MGEGSTGVRRGLGIAAVPWVVWAWPRRAVGEQSVFGMPREQQLFLNRPELAAPYREAAELAARGEGG